MSPSRILSRGPSKFVLPPLAVEFRVGRLVSCVSALPPLPLCLPSAHLWALGCDEQCLSGGACSLVEL